MADLGKLIARYRGYITAEGNGGSLSEDEMFALLDCAEALQQAQTFLKVLVKARAVHSTGRLMAQIDTALSRLASAAKEE